MKLLVFYIEATEKKLPVLGGRLVSCHISIQGIKFELYPSAIHDHTNTCYFIAIVKTSHSGQWMFWHFIRLFDWRTHLLIQIVSEIVSETVSGMAVLLHVTPAMPRKFRGDWAWSYFYGRSLFAADLCREIVIYWRNYVQSLRRAKHV